MEKKKGKIVTKYNMKYLMTEIKETFDEYVKSLESKYLMPNEYSIEFINAKYKKVIINNDETYQTFIKENAKLNKIRAFIIEKKKEYHLNKTMIIRKTHPEKLLSSPSIEKKSINKPIFNKKKKGKKEKLICRMKSLSLTCNAKTIVGVNIKLIKLAPPRFPVAPIKIKNGSN